MNIYFLFPIIIVFLIFYKFNKSISKIFKLEDKNKTPLIGGLFLLIGYFLNYFYIKLTSGESIYLINLFFLFSVFFLAFLDDKYNIIPSVRLVLLTIIISLLISLDNFFIQTLNSKYFGFYYTPENFLINIFLPIFCILVFINAFNFTDGINGLASLMGISWLVYLGIKYTFLINMYLLFFIFLSLFLIMNLKNKMYLGDSGNYIISLIVGYLLIIINKNIPYSIYIEEILLLLLIPGLDLIRLFFKRIKNKKNPFEGDNHHLHHYLIKNLGLNKTLFLYLVLINFPIYLFFIMENLLIFLLVTKSLAYFYLIKKFSSN